MHSTVSRKRWYSDGPIASFYIFCLENESYLFHLLDNYIGCINEL